MRIHGGTPVPMPESDEVTKKTAEESSDAPADSGDVVEPMPARFSEELIQALSSFSSTDPAALQPQLSSDLNPGLVDSPLGETPFEDQIKLDFSGGLFERMKLDQGLSPTNNLGVDVLNGDRHMGVTGAETNQQGLETLGLTGEGDGNAGTGVVLKNAGPSLVNPKMGLVSSISTTTHADGSKEVMMPTKNGSRTTFYDPSGNLTGTHVKSTEEGVTTTKVYDGKNDYQGKVATSADGQMTIYDKDGNEVKSDPASPKGSDGMPIDYSVQTEAGEVKYHRNYDDDGEYQSTTITNPDGTTQTVGKDEKYTTEEGAIEWYLPTVEEFLALVSFGGGYTDGVNSDLQNPTPLEFDVSRTPYFGKIDGNPDATSDERETLDVQNTTQPETRPELQGPDFQMPVNPGDPNSDGT